MATQLPTVMLKGVRFIIDERLHEIRDINNPHVREDFDDLTDESRA